MTGTPVFDEVIFPLDVALRAAGGPERRTEIVALGSGREVRNARWADSRRRYDAGSGLRSLDDLHAVLAFFEARRGRLHGFLYRDPVDHRSGPPSRAPTPLDQPLGTGDGVTTAFALAKRYGDGARAWSRAIERPLAASVRVAVAGVERRAGIDFAVAAIGGLVTFAGAAVPPAGVAITAGFEFLVPVRFDTDEIRVDLAAFLAGEIPSIPLVEIRP
ncbi:TIGR02217 family protein [Siculibacillus lacustris]|uniref:TIGR02217 family protein n=1 Tax=Siculibacillus lacustris TaxID=1549641 RepID=A0A4Q9VX70_9HYPH|nr:DUF2460 domain-containing protein [Siculibacillus lacustris]TBW40983.1 TIGR02217 family protein [Siculibacillus lacustris]